MAATSACAALTGTRGGKAPIARHVDAARERLGDAMAADRHDAVAALLADSVVARVPGRAVVGRDSVAAFLLAHDGPLPMTAEPSFADVCSAGARDVGTVATRDERLYAYEVDWTEAAGGARVASFRFGDVPSDLATLRIGCASEWPSIRYFQRRFEIFGLLASPRTIGFSHANDLDRAMLAQGWPRACYPGDPGGCPSSLYAPFAKADVPAVVGVQTRIGPRAGIELAAGKLGSTISTAHSPQSDYYVARAVHEPRFVAALATLDLGVLRFGAGPAVSNDRWRWGNVSRFTDVLTDNVEHWTTTTAGGVLEADATLAIGYAEALQLRWQSGWFGRQRVRPFDGMNAMMVRSGYQLLGIAIAFRP